jgi:hypothetical protein
LCMQVRQHLMHHAALPPSWQPWRHRLLAKLKNSESCRACNRWVDAGDFAQKAAL